MLQGHGIQSSPHPLPSGVRCLVHDAVQVWCQMGAPFTFKEPHLGVEVWAWESHVQQRAGDLGLYSSGSDLVLMEGAQY